MATLNPQHLLEQAGKLVEPPPAGPLRQVDVRRAISAAYYAVFHFISACAADEIIGKTKRNDNRYALVYRSVDHRRLKDFCADVKKPIMPDKFKRFLPGNGFGRDIQAFASAVIELQEKRHAADYDPAARVATADALVAVELARTAIERFEHASKPRRKAFLTLLVFSPR